MAQLQPFDPVGAFQKARSNRLAIEGKEQDLSLQPQRTKLLDLKLQQADQDMQRGQKDNDLNDAIQRAEIIHNSAKALLKLPDAQIPAAFQRLGPRLQEFGIDPAQFENHLTRENLQNAVASTAGFLQDPIKGLTAAQREFESLSIDLSEEDKLRARRIELGLDPRASISAPERIVQDPALQGDIVEFEGQKAGAKETSTSEAKLIYAPMIAEAVKNAEIAATERGEVLTDLSRAEAGLPGLLEAVGELKNLAPLATSTKAGRAFNAIAHELGFGATEGATARSKYISIIRNQVLPLLKPTFGGAFSIAEGEKLEATMGDPDVSPDEKIAQLEAFINNKYREIQTKQRQLNIPTTDFKNISNDELLDFSFNDSSPTFIYDIESGELKSAV